MKKFFAIAILFVGTFTFAQNSSITATVTDADGQTWNNGTYQITFVPPSGYIGSAYTFNGTTWTPPAPINGVMNGSGVFSYSPLPRNDYILPSGSGWAFTVCPVASSPCSTTTFVINQATQNLSSLLVVVAPRFAASNVVLGSFGYNDQEILPINPPIGNFYWNVTLAGMRCYNGSAFQSCSSGITSVAWGSITGTLSDQTDLETVLNLKAPLASPAFTGTPTAPTGGSCVSNADIATQAYVQNCSPSGGINQLTGDATAGPGSGSQAITLATVNSSAGTCGDATHSCQISTNAKGLVTNQIAVPISGGGGGVTQISPGTVISVNPSGGTGNVTVNAGIPWNSTLIYCCTSINDDDNANGTGSLSPAVTVTATTQSGSTLTITNSSTNGFHIGDWISTRYLTGQPACPSGEALGTGCTLFQVLSSGFSSTQIELNVGALTFTPCSVSCGNLHSAMTYLPFVTSAEPNMPPNALANTVVFIPNPVTIGGGAAGYATFIHPFRPGVTGKPAYLIINNANNDAGTCTASATTEAAYQSLFSSAHTDSILVAVGTPNGTQWSQFSLGCSTAYNLQAAIDYWLRGNGKAAVQAVTPTSTQYWDIGADISTALWDGADSQYIAQSNSALAPAGVDAAGKILATALFEGTNSLPAHGALWWGVGQSSGFQTVNGIMLRPTVDQFIYFSNTLGTANEFRFDLSDGEFDGGKGLFGTPTCNGSWALCVGTSGDYFQADAFGDIQQVGSGLTAQLQATTVTSLKIPTILSAPALGTDSSGNLISVSASSGALTNLGSVVTWSMGSGAGTFANGVFKVTTAGSSIQAASIPGTYIDLIFECELRGDASANDIHSQTTFNGDTGTNYDDLSIQGNGSSATAFNNVGANFFIFWDIPAASATASYSGGGDFTIKNYSGTTFFKHASSSNGLLFAQSGSDIFSYRGDGWWRSTSAITSITQTASSGNFIAGSTCAIWGRN